MDVRLPNGTVIRGVPEGTSKEAIKQKAIAAGVAQESDFESAFVTTMKQPGAPEEVLASIASSIIAEPVAGIAGLAQSLNPFADEGAGADAVQKTRDALTYQPKIKAAQIGQQGLGETLQPVGEAFSKAETTLGETTLDYTGSEELAAAAHTLPTAVLEMLGIAGLKGFKPAVKKGKDIGKSVVTKSKEVVHKPVNLLQAGQPTEQLNKMLNSRGLVYENLTPEARNVIPEITKAGQNPGKMIDEVWKRQIRTGGTDDALAGFRIVDNKVVKDSAAIIAAKQGFDPGFIQAVKVADPATKQGMKRMVNIMRRVKSNKTLAAKGLRPTDVVGDSLSRRVSYIRDTANEARESLNRIANTQLKGKKIDSSAISQAINDELAKLKINEAYTGQPIKDFKGSLISKDATSQGVINDLIDLMNETQAPDALRFHDMKRQLDNLIDFKKKSKDGLTDAGKKVLKSVRHQINQELRAINPSYAKVNDTLSTSLTALDDLQNVLGSNIDMFGPGANKAIGQDLRGLLSNRKTRVKLENAVNGIEDTAKQLGGKFDDDIQSLVMFADNLEDRFGAVATTSLKGDLESTIKSTMDKGVTGTAKDKVVDFAAKKANEARGVSDYHAYGSLNTLLNR